MTGFFNSDAFMPHGHCFLWQADIFWLHVLSDSGIAMAYFSIPFALVWLLHKRKDIPFEGIFLLFAAFILLCGATHIMSIWVLWHPDYALEGVLKAMTAVASIVTFLVIVRMIPRILAIPSPAALATVNLKLQQTTKELELYYRQAKANSDSHIVAIFNTVLDGLITIDAHGSICMFNPAAVKIFGYQPEEVMGENIKMLMPEPYHSGHDGYLRDFITSGHAKVIGIGREVSGKRKDGSVFPMELGVNEMLVEGKRMFVGTVRDITEKKALQADMASQMEAIGKSQAVIEFDMDGVILSANAHYLDIVGYTMDEIRGKHHSMFLDKDYKDSPEYTHFWEKLRTGEYHTGEFRRYGKGGREVWIQGAYSPCLNMYGKPYKIIKFATDRTQEKAEENYRKMLTAQLLRSNQELDDFAYIASHDLKEPLRGLSNNANFLREDFEDKLSEDGVKRIKRMMYLCERMERLVNDLLYFSRLGRQELAVQETDLNDVIADIVSMMETTLHDAHAVVRIREPLPVVVCDLPRVTEVFRNLITNAVKYNKSPEKIVEVGSEMRDGELVFYVRDNGIGILPEFYDEVFRIFKRLNNEDDNVKGTGVGLTFVRKIIERHNGRIWIEPAAGEGTVFCFTLQQKRTDL